MNLTSYTHKLRLVLRYDTDGDAQCTIMPANLLHRYKDLSIFWSCYSTCITHPQILLLAKWDRVRGFVRWQQEQSAWKQTSGKQVEKVITDYDRARLQYYGGCLSFGPIQFNMSPWWVLIVVMKIVLTTVSREYVIVLTSSFRVDVRNMSGWRDKLPC